jgi:cation-transporting ATPase I
MRVPGLTVLAGAALGAGTGLVRVGAQVTETAVGAAVGTTLAVVEPLAQVTFGAGRAVQAVVTGTSGNAVPSVAWSSGRRLHFDLHPMMSAQQLALYGADIAAAVTEVPAVSAAHVEGALGRLVVDRDPDADPQQVRAAVGGAVARVLSAPRTGAERGTSSAATSIAAVADPGDLLAIGVPLAAAALAAAAVVGAVVGKFSAVPAAPRAARAAVAVVRHQPRVLGLLEAQLGRVGADVLLSVASAAADGFGQSPVPPLLDSVQRVGQVAEAVRHRQCWERREPALASSHRPQAPVVPVTRSDATAGDADGSRHSWGPAAAGDVSHVMVDAAIDVAVDGVKGAAAGVIESYTDQAAAGSLMAAAGALLASGRADDVAQSVLAGVPKAAQMGREAFASMLGRGLARADLLILDPGALRRLDRVQVVVVDGAALRGDARAVLRSTGQVEGWDTDRVYEVADALLHGETAPKPDADELPAEGARLRWHPNTGGGTAPAQGLEHADLVVDGATVGVVAVGWELDPFAVPLLETARRAGVRVVLRHVAGTEELAGSVDAAHSPGTPLLRVVRGLRAERGPVLLISALHPDFASADTLAALAIADVAVALDDPRAAAPWTADIITSTDLVQAVRVLSALPAARTASASAVRLAKAGTTLAGLLLVTGQGATRTQLGLGRWLDPVNTAGATALISGTWAARATLRRPDPDPLPLTAWHALDAEVVYGRLTGSAMPLAAGPGRSPWRRRWDDLSENPLLSPALTFAQVPVRLLSATRHELSDPLTPVLAVGAAASAILGSSVDALLVAGVMGVNALIGGGQRLRAENAAAELFAEQDQLARRVVIPAAATTRRRLSTARTGTRTLTVPAHRLRAGDVIDLRTSDVVPADARLLLVDDLEVDESSLTGESVPVDKTVEAATAGSGIAERASMVFEGSSIVAGQARAIVVATGNATAARRAVAAVSGVGPPVGVQARLKELTGKALPLTLAGGGIVTGLSLLRRRPMRDAVADGVAIAVAAVPEGLPLVATLAQLAAARRLSTAGVLVRSPRTLEALGRVHTVCFDKTGTLTQNQLTVVHVTSAEHDSGTPFLRVDDEDSAPLLRAAARACPQLDDGHAHAHATDEAIIAAAVAAGIDLGWDVIADAAFESSRGYAAAVGIDHTSLPNEGAPEQLLVLKGSPEGILDRCELTGTGITLTDAHRLVDAMAGEGLRVLALAQRTLPAPLELAGQDTDTEVIDAAAQSLQLLGFVGLADTPRPSARPLLEQLVDAGLHVAVITGDHPVTAQAIARQLGLTDTTVVTGAQLAALDDAARADLAVNAQVFARVSPEQKVQVVAALQRAGRVTAMVGDGANDAAAIRMADVGIGVTNRGSSAARGAADLVLTDNDLTVLLDALVEGRTMWGSVRDALAILLGGNAGEVAFTIIGTALGGRAPVSTRQLLLVNLLTDMFPALAVAVTPQDTDTDVLDTVVDDPDTLRIRRRQVILQADVPSLDRPLVQTILSRGAATAAGATLAWGIGRFTPGTERRSSTMGLTALVGTQLAQTLLTRRRSPLVIATATGSAIVLVGIVQTPGISHFFGCTPLGPVAWTGVLGATTAATIVATVAPAWLHHQTAHRPDRNETITNTTAQTPVSDDDSGTRVRRHHSTTPHLVSVH